MDLKNPIPGHAFKKMKTLIWKEQRNSNVTKHVDYLQWVVVESNTGKLSEGGTHYTVEYYLAIKERNIAMWSNPKDLKIKVLIKLSHRKTKIWEHLYENRKNIYKMNYFQNRKTTDIENKTYGD